MVIHAKTALLGSEWERDVRVHIVDGRIARIDRASPPQPGDLRVDTLLPALANLHSHSFQRAMAGRTEYRKKGSESFWTWRELMYRFLDHLTPEHIEAIAALVFMEMQEAGYASVGEFHYVHHQPGGMPYANRSETSQRILSAAAQTGIGLTLLPVLYAQGDVDSAPLAGGQLRFGNDVDAYLSLVSDCSAAIAYEPEDTALGIAPHSLRAVSPAALADVLAATPEGPVHIHVAEQAREVEAVSAHLGNRPVEWLLDHTGVDKRWCLIHATHMTADETRRLARTGAVAGLCPVTEANLGDGIFNGADYISAGGAFGVGSDSNVRISLTEELRMLEYSQRLRDRARTVLVPGAGSVGQALYTGAAKGGAQALGRDAGRIEAGALADLVAINSNHPALYALRDEQLLDGLCFAAPDTVVTDLWSAGRHCVQGGRHVERAAIVAGFAKAMDDLLARA